MVEPSTSSALSVSASRTWPTKRPYFLASVTVPRTVEPGGTATLPLE
ncbi:MAG: hypothetical protein HYV15_07405 [Elusimicrobia bacterium]|nr:hypothetical protein [Elusimicrobiota bacterium]